ncbi:hypothetical protein JTE90_006806 [Oedothorax gibbosus]|uniref:PH domain-containing protein n=1 Tax=Oedothorax gibbosus TaxID=931172 RepID=A0AAV6VPY6_9ARAC|nr:hypothetical protein JTE90_006806 [Oedothorax gibbosus]
MIGNLVQVCVCSGYSKMDIPASDSFASPLKTGFLLKLTGRGWLYSGTWKKRYCVLDGSKFYFYEKEQSKGSEKTSGVLNLDYFDVCEESPSDKKNPHVFVVGTSVKGFFDNRHQFSAETADDLQSWIRTIQNAITDARDSRRKPAGRKQRHLEEKSPDLSHSSQEGATSPTCLENVTKDRVRGPQGRRLPQRKSMMPASRKEVIDEEIRQRSISVSSPQRSDTTPPQSPGGVDTSKWLSLSMEEVDREREEEGELERSSSVFDLPQKPEPKVAPKRGGLMGQHAALTKELEMRLKAGRRPPSQSEDTTVEDEPKESEDRRLDALSSRVDETRQTNSLRRPRWKPQQEAERINDECKRALADANRAKEVYQMLAKECRDTLDQLSKDPQSQHNHGA